MADPDWTHTAQGKSPRRRSGDGVLKHIAVAFLLALALYAITFSWIEGKRSQKGPWHVTFRTDAEGQPSVSVSQPSLKISNVRFTFPDERIGKTNLIELVIFDSPITNVPFGRVVYLDTTFLPGALTLNLFGHEIEFLPRTLVVDRTEKPWQAGQTFELRQQNK